MFSNFAPPGCLYASPSAVKAALLEPELCGTPLCIMRGAHQAHKRMFCCCWSRETTWSLPLPLSSSSSLPLLSFNRAPRSLLQLLKTNLTLAGFLLFVFFIWFLFPPRPIKYAPNEWCPLPLHLLPAIRSMIPVSLCDLCAPLNLSDASHMVQASLTT